MSLLYLIHVLIICSGYGYTPLMLATSKGYVQIMMILLQHPAIKLNGKDNKGKLMMLIELMKV